jgi:pyridoxamine 5'-phosphate oxidase
MDALQNILFVLVSTNNPEQEQLMSLQNLRREYNQAQLELEDLHPDPMSQFRAWFDHAVTANAIEANAMTLATIGLDGQPMARIVLLKEIDDQGFVFFTNYLSRKGQEIAANPHATLLFFWPQLEQQIRIEGTVSKVSSKESDEYFAIRPRESQLGAWASLQSESLESRAQLEQQLTDVTAKYHDQTVPRPEHWGGYRLIAHRFEFWQGRPNRLHDRFEYQPAPNGGFLRQRLSPLGHLISF